MKISRQLWKALNKKIYQQIFDHIQRCSLCANFHSKLEFHLICFGYLDRIFQKTDWYNRCWHSMALSLSDVHISFGLYRNQLRKLSFCQKTHAQQHTHTHSSWVCLFFCGANVYHHHHCNHCEWFLSTFVLTLIRFGKASHRKCNGAHVFIATAHKHCLCLLIEINVRLSFKNVRLFTTDNRDDDCRATIQQIQSFFPRLLFRYSLLLYMFGNVKLK